MRGVLVGSVCAAITLGGCAHDVMARFPSTPSDPTSTLVVLFGQPASEVAVSIDGWLVCSDAHTARVVVDGVPVGTREVALSANGSDKQFKVWVGTDHATTIPVGAPDAGLGFFKTIAGTIITLLVYSWLKV